MGQETVAWPRCRCTTIRENSRLDLPAAARDTLTKVHELRGSTSHGCRASVRHLPPGADGGDGAPVLGLQLFQTTVSLWLGLAGPGCGPSPTGRPITSGSGCGTNRIRSAFTKMRRSGATHGYSLSRSLPDIHAGAQCESISRRRIEECRAKARRPEGRERHSERSRPFQCGWSPLIAPRGRTPPRPEPLSWRNVVVHFPEDEDLKVAKVAWNKICKSFGCHPARALYRHGRPVENHGHIRGDAPSLIRSISAEQPSAWRRRP